MILPPVIFPGCTFSDKQSSLLAKREFFTLAPSNLSGACLTTKESLITLTSAEVRGHQRGRRTSRHQRHHHRRRYNNDNDDDDDDDDDNDDDYNDDDDRKLLRRSDGGKPSKSGKNE